MPSKPSTWREKIMSLPAPCGLYPAALTDDDGEIGGDGETGLGKEV
jgi:hypothetical protein